MDVNIIKDESEIYKVLDVFIEVFSEFPYEESWTRELAFKRLLEIYTRGKGFCLYVEDHGAVIGLVFCQTMIWPDGTHLMIEDTAIDASCRQLGVGRLLVCELEKIAKNEGIVAIDMLVNTQAKAMFFWEHLGYQKDGYIGFTKRL